MSHPTEARLLIVDDEPNVISSLTRALRGQTFQIHSATSGVAALDVLQREPIDLIISDSRMPGMDGPTLLGEIEHRWPDVMRILLTGYEDNAQTIKAINEGRIFRYIAKPWDTDDLMRSIDQALAHQYLQRDRARLQQLTQQQNKALQEANGQLEARVALRTEELTRTAEMLTDAHRALKHAYVTATEVFSSLLSQRLPRSRQTNREIIELVRAFCKLKAYPQKFTDDVVMAAALYNVGKLTWNDPLIALPPELMERDQRLRYRDYPQTGERLLMALEPVHDAAIIIRHHQERWDGAGFPDGLTGENIPLGARILKLAVDYVEIQMGMVFARKVPTAEVVENMPKFAGRLYDPTLCYDFVEMAKQIEAEAHQEPADVILHKTDTLEPGMIIARNLHNLEGMLLLREGAVISERLIRKLQDFEENEETRYTIYVRLPAEEEQEG